MKPRVVIVGAGFGGIAAARALRRAKADVILIDRTNHHLFQPLLYQVATAALSPADIATATRALLRRQANATVLMAEVTGVEHTAKQLACADGRIIPYNYLILATGAAYSFFGQDEWRAHSRTLKSLDDALAIREELLLAFEKAEQCDDPDEVRRLLTFVVIGGGQPARRWPARSPNWPERHWRAISGVLILNLQGSSCANRGPRF
nr:FAD-dependent oxidoreductase [Sphingobium fuliginis]